MAGNGREEADGERADLTASERKALACLRREDEVTSVRVAESAGLSERTARRAMAGLVEKGLAVARGASRNRTYAPRGGA